jgi:hypothetical protein
LRSPLSLFGFKVIRAEEEKAQDNLVSFAQKETDDGAVVVSPMGGSYGAYVDFSSEAKTEAELIDKYREIALQPELDSAIDEIVNEAINTEENDVVDVNTDNLEGYSESIKNTIRKEFDNIKKIMDLNNVAYELFRRWYIDGREYFHIIIDETAPQEGIKELRYIDPRKIRKIREMEKKKVDDIILQTVKNEYYVYSEKGFSVNSKTQQYTPQDTVTQGIKISDDSIILTTSGLMNETNSMVLSYLHKAIKPMNQLRSLEDASIIYRLARAPERRIFYIDVGNLPKHKAEQYLYDMMTKHKNKIVYDASTGKVRDDRKHMTMLEDFWFPRREGGRGTEITTLQGGQNLGEMEDIKYFQQNLYGALGIPVSRLEQGQGGFSLGRSSEITRDELKFQKFINRLRKRFSFIFYKALEKQLILKNIIVPEEWDDIKNNIYFDFKKDNFFTEFKNAELLNNRIDLMTKIQPFIGMYYSSQWAMKNVLHLTDEDIERIQGEMQEGGDTEKFQMYHQQDNNFDKNTVGDGGSKAQYNENTEEFKLDETLINTIESTANAVETDIKLNETITQYLEKKLQISE